MVAFMEAFSARIWRSRRDAAKFAGFNVWTFNRLVDKAVRLGFIVQEPMKPPARRPFRFRPVDQFDPPAIQPERQEESPMPSNIADSIGAPPPSLADPPPEPTRDDNRRIRACIETNFDDVGGYWVDDWSDEKAAAKLGVPRAWVARIRDLYGDDRNEAEGKANAEALALAERAAALEATALDLATKAETLGRDVRQFLERRRP
jgi:hypothetical protein